MTTDCIASWRIGLKMHICTMKTTRHNNETFRKDVTQLYEELKSRGNPFLDDREELENINSKCIMSSASSAFVRNALNIGLQAYDKFLKKGLCQENIRSMTQSCRINSPNLVRQIHC